MRGSSARVEVRLEAGLDGLPVGSFGVCENRGRSEEVRGVETEERGSWLFLRRGGKYPSAFRDMRAISTGLADGEESINTQRTCCHGSSSDSRRSADVPIFVEDVRGHVKPLVTGGGSSMSGVEARRSTP